MTKKIESLTEEQKAELSAFAQRRIRECLEIKPVDKEKSEIAIRRMYEIANIKAPEKIEWVASPKAGAIEASRRQGGGWHGWISGGWWAGFTAYIDACRDILNVDLGPAGEDFAKVYDNLDPMAFYWPNEDFCLASERPICLRRDDEGRLHCEDGPAIAWADGYAIYSWRGTVVPAEWITNRKNLDPSVAITHPQIEQRRAAAEIIGWEKVLNKLGAKVVDKDADPEIGELLEADLPDAPASRFLKVRCGTGRTFVLSVPSEMKTALEANAWTYGIDPDFLRTMEVRT